MKAHAPRELVSLDVDSAASRLRAAVFEIMGFAYLLQQQQGDPAPPENIDAIRFGQGQILMRIGKRLTRIADQLEGIQRKPVRR